MPLSLHYIGDCWNQPGKIKWKRLRGVLVMRWLLFTFGQHVAVPANVFLQTSLQFRLVYRVILLQPCLGTVSACGPVLPHYVGLLLLNK